MDPGADIGYNANANYEPPYTQFSPWNCEFLGCMNPIATNYDINATLGDGSCIIVAVGCTDPSGFNYDPGFTVACNGFNGNDGAVIPCVSNEFGYFQMSVDCCCVPTVPGCVNDVTAINYLQASGMGIMDANVDDGSCIALVPGCMDPTSCDYDPLANEEDGSCTWCFDVVANNYDGDDGQTNCYLRS